MKRIIEKYSKTILIIVILMLPTIFLIGRLTKSDLGAFPFEASVWGTVYDYISLIITIISLYLIFKTLEAQYTTIKQQQDSLKHQAEELRLNKIVLISKLEFNFEIQHHPSYDGELYDINFINRGDDIYQVYIETHSNLEIYDHITGRIVKSKSRNFDTKTSLLKGNQAITIQLKDSVQDEEYFTLNFMDIYGGKHSQTVFLNNQGQHYFLPMQDYNI